MPDSHDAWQARHKTNAQMTSKVGDDPIGGDWLLFYKCPRVHAPPVHRHRQPTSSTARKHPPTWYSASMTFSRLSKDLVSDSRLRASSMPCACFSHHASSSSSSRGASRFMRTCKPGVVQETLSCYIHVYKHESGRRLQHSDAHRQKARHKEPGSCTRSVALLWCAAAAAPGISPGKRLRGAGSFQGLCRGRRHACVREDSPHRCTCTRAGGPQCLTLHCRGALASVGHRSSNRRWQAWGTDHRIGGHIQGCAPIRQGASAPPWRVRVREHTQPCQIPHHVGSG